MACRVVHIIRGDCEIFLHKSRDIVRIRVSDSPDSHDPTDFELEGGIDAMRELVSTLTTVMTHIEAIGGEVH